MFAEDPETVEAQSMPQVAVQLKIVRHRSDVAGLAIAIDERMEAVRAMTREATG